MATNRADTLDPALLRPGRLDRKIEFPLPDRRQKRLVFQTITGKMNLSDEVDLEDCKREPPFPFLSFLQSLSEDIQSHRFFFFFFFEITTLFGTFLFFSISCVET